MMDEQHITIIPARLAATRLPDKPLAEIDGVPMIVRVMQRALAAGGPVLVAAADAAIADAVQAAGGEAVLTDPDLPSGSDRIHAALALYDPEGRYQRVVNVQGDLPLLEPALIGRVAALLTHADMSTLVAEITDMAERDNPNVVKAVVSFDGEQARALYFSRAPVPSGDTPLYHHIGIYGFRRAALERFVALPPSPLERAERLEQLRALEAGMEIAVARVDAVPLGVDTPEDLHHARALAAAR